MLRSESRAFQQTLESRYAGFINPAAHPHAIFDIDLRNSPVGSNADEDLQVELKAGLWSFQRGDFVAQWDPDTGVGQIHQNESPYGLDSVLRIVHSLLLASSGGMLIHAASAIRGGRAFLFSGVSGAGKTTISRLAPPDVTLLTDEISYIRRSPDGYAACGTPFAGELAKAGENCSAPLDTIFLLEKGRANRIEPIPVAQAAQALMRNILFFSHDRGLVEQVFESACRLIESVSVQRLVFFPDAHIWEIIGATAGATT